MDEIENKRQKRKAKSLALNKRIQTDPRTLNQVGFELWKTRKSTIRRHKLNPGECPYCDRERTAKNDFHPAHDASARCQSGGHPHCTCDTCF